MAVAVAVEKRHRELSLSDLRALTREVKRWYPNLESRWERAFTILASGCYFPQPDGAWWVQSQRDPAKYYRVWVEHTTGCRGPASARTPGTGRRTSWSRRARGSWRYRRGCGARGVAS